MWNSSFWQAKPRLLMQLPTLFAVLLGCLLIPKLIKKVAKIRIFFFWSIGYFEQIVTLEDYFGKYDHPKVCFFMKLALVF